MLCEFKSELRTTSSTVSRANLVIVGIEGERGVSIPYNVKIISADLETLSFKLLDSAHNPMLYKARVSGLSANQYGTYQAMCVLAGQAVCDGRCNRMPQTDQGLQATPTHQHRTPQTQRCR